MSDLSGNDSDDWEPNMMVKKMTRKPLLVDDSEDSVLISDDSNAEIVGCTTEEEDSGSPTDTTVVVGESFEEDAHRSYNSERGSGGTPPPAAVTPHSSKTDELKQLQFCRRPESDTGISADGTAAGRGTRSSAINRKLEDAVEIAETQRFANFSGNVLTTDASTKPLNSETQNKVNPVLQGQFSQSSDTDGRDSFENVTKKKNEEILKSPQMTTCTNANDEQLQKADQRSLKDVYCSVMDKTDLSSSDESFTTAYPGGDTLVVASFNEDDIANHQSSPSEGVDVSAAVDTKNGRNEGNKSNVFSSPTPGSTVQASLDFTEIPGSTSPNVSKARLSQAWTYDESWEEWTSKISSKKKSSDPLQTHSEPQSQEPNNNNNGPRVSTVDEDLEDMLVEGLNNITLKSTKEFSFKKKKTNATTSGSKNKLPSPAGATFLGYYDESQEEDDDVSLSASFGFDDAFKDINKSDDSEVRVIPRERYKKQAVKAEAKPSREVVTLDDSENEVEDLTNHMKKLPLGSKVAKKAPPSRTIFLNEPLPIEKRTFAYDPTNVQHQEFYGDVQRTVSKMAEIMESMPMPGDEGAEELILPKGLVPLFDHQRYGLRWLIWREQEFPGGGILADEMGLGKTIMIIALIMKSKMDALEREKENWADTAVAGNCIQSKTTLVVCPLGCLTQWTEEIQSKGRGLKVYTYHGPDRTRSAAKLAQFDIVLSTYQTVQSELPKDTHASKNRSPLKRLYWQRIVLDEAHMIRNPKTATALAVCQLESRHRWAVTGTPVHNKPEDFFSVIKFLRMKPFDESEVFEFWIGMKQVRKAVDAQRRLHTLAKALTLRRTKKEVDEAGGNVQKIPPKTVEIVEVELEEGERRIYDHLMQYCKGMFAQFLMEKEKRDQLNAAALAFTSDDKRRKKESRDGDGLPQDIRFSTVLALLIRLKQCAVHPHLISTMLEDEEIDQDESFNELNDAHIISKINPVFDRLYQSSKIQKILEDLEELRRDAEEECRPMDKIVIISSWTTTLDILHEHLRERRFSCVFITGKENTIERSDNTKRFNKYPQKYHICLLSLMAGGVGLNLVGGNHVFFVEPHWNPQLELQAQDRVHRFGQTRSVKIKRYISKETVEERILEIQGEKIDLADGVLNSAKKTRGGGLSIPQLKRLFQ